VQSEEEEEEDSESEYEEIEELTEWIPPDSGLQHWENITITEMKEGDHTFTVMESKTPVGFFNNATSNTASSAAC
jgi:hypothetical protein